MTQLDQVDALRAHTNRSEPDTSRLLAWGRFVARHARVVLVVWLILGGFAVVGAGNFRSDLVSSSRVVGGSDSLRAAELVADEFPDAPDESDLVVIHSDELTVGDADFDSTVTAVESKARADEDVISVLGPADSPALISKDRHTALVSLGLAGDKSSLSDTSARLTEQVAALGTPQVSVYFTGSTPLADAAGAQSDRDVGRAETIGLPVAAVVLIWAFGSLAAAAIPLTLGVGAVVVAFGSLSLISGTVAFDAFAQTTVTMVGIALGIDYSLFVVTRFREELAARGASMRDREEAVARTTATAGRAVLFSGVTVIIAVVGLFIVRIPSVRAMAICMIITVVVMLAISVTLLPAILTVLGPRVNSLRIPFLGRRGVHPDPEHSRWGKMADAVMRRPVVSVLVAGGLLVALAAPALRLEYGVDLGVNAVGSSPAGVGYGYVSTGFAPGMVGPIDVVVQSRAGVLDDGDLDALARFSDALSDRDDVAQVTGLTTLLDDAAGSHSRAALDATLATAEGRAMLPVGKSADVTVLTVIPQGSADSTEAAALVKHLRTAGAGTLGSAGLDYHVGGAPAQIVDVTAESTRAMPLLIAVVLLASYLMLFLAFKSVLLPAKAICMNLLTVGVAFGLGVSVFQDGFGADLLGVDRTGFIQVIIPIFAFALVFGLSMDYEVFMLSRIREEWLRTGDNRAAIRIGMTHTARVITAAAAIMVIIFASFILTRVLEIKQVGFILAVAVAVDATVVRLVLVPSLMALMGKWNWWSPFTKREKPVLVRDGEGLRS